MRNILTRIAPFGHKLLNRISPTLTIAAPYVVPLLDVYTTGVTTIQQIANRMRLNRITVHSAVERLIESQLLSESREGKRRIIAAEPPERLLKIVEAKQHKLDRVRQQTEKTVALLNDLPRQEYSDPNIRIYRGIEGLKRLLEETLEAKGILRIAVDIEHFRKLLPSEELLALYRRRAHRGITTRFIFPHGSFSKLIDKHRAEMNIDLRTFKTSKQWKVAWYTWNDKVGIESLVEGQIHCMIIRNREIAIFYQNFLFDSLWESLEN